MNPKERVTKQSKLKNFGKPLLKVRLKLAHHTCYTKTMQTPNPINKTWELSRAQISVVKLWNTLQKMKLQFVI